MSETKPTVVQAFSAVQEDVLAIEKGERNREQNFMFRGYDTVVNAVGPVLRRHRVIIIPTAEDIQLERYVTNKGTAMKCATVRMRFTVYGPAGDSLSGVTFGEAADAGDKAVSKAQSVAYRVFLLQGLTIPTNEPDADSKSHERVAFSQEAQDARDELAELCDGLGITRALAMKDFAAANGGLDIRHATDPGPIRALAERYRTAQPADSALPIENQEPAGEQ